MLLADSVLLLQSLQLDMDYPEPWHLYARQCLDTQLAAMAGKPLNPDRLRLRLNSPECWVDEQGQEHDSLECSLTDLAVASADQQQSSALLGCVPVDDRPLPELPQLTASALLVKTLDNRWFDDYKAQLDRFWQRHAETWLSLARLAFLDGLARQRKRTTLSEAGFHLTLNALGYLAFPADSQALMSPDAPGDKAEVRLLYIDGEVVPGLFQVRSRLNSHCFIHLPGTAQATIEYISDDDAVISRRLLQALNGSNWHRQWLDQRAADHDQPPHIESRPVTGDVFRLLLIACRACAEVPPDKHGQALSWRMISRSMALAGAVDLWQSQPSILGDIPRPDTVANERVQRWLKEQHGLDLDPRQVFIAYRGGRTHQPLGHVKNASTYIHVPDETPLTLANAMISHYRIESPSGYIDEGARTVIYRDPGGKGSWAEERVLPISAEAFCQYLEQLDFLAIMTARIDAFWEGQQARIEQALGAMLVTQAIIGLKSGTLTRDGFDTVVSGLTRMQPVWKALGFEVQAASFTPLIRQPCASLLVLYPDHTARCVLYQAGQHQALMEFADTRAMSTYLQKACANEQWRTAVLAYVPTRHRERLAYLFKHWSGVKLTPPPLSVLRPWTDTLHNPDANRTLAHSLHEHPLPSGPPMSFMRQTLKANALEDARELIVTSRQAWLHYWSARLRHLQWLLAPMSFLLTPAMLASLAAQIGVVVLDIAKANLPGHRQAEKHQALLSTLSLGLLALTPHTPRLSNALGKIGAVGKAVLKAPTAQRHVLHESGRWLRRSLSRRQTRLEKFFYTDSLLKRWTIGPHPDFGGLPVHAWKVGRKFLLWTSDRGQARTLVVSTHGYYLPWSKTVPIPNGTQIHTYAPHGHVLMDPALHRVVSRRVSPFAVSSAAGNSVVGPASSLPPLAITDKLIAGTTLPGRLKNYTLSKFQSEGGESYQEIVHAVRNSNARALGSPLPAMPMDVLSVRNRFGSTAPTLEDLFNNLAAQGIHYDRILLLHCRCEAINASLRRIPDWTAPLLGSHPPESP